MCMSPTESAEAVVVPDMKAVDHKYLHPTRRLFLAGLTVAPALVLAHEDHGSVDVIADADVLSVTGQTLTLALTMYNRGTHALTLFWLRAEGAATAEALFAPLEAGGRTKIEITLHFDGPVPGIFTAVLDFGTDGQGPVLVMP